MQSGQSWVKVCGTFDSALQIRAELSVVNALSTGKYKQSELDHVSAIKKQLLTDKNISAENLEKLRRLCQLWEVELYPMKISSHRRFVGPFIVGVKRLLVPILRAILGETLKVQREFNATAIGILAEISNTRKNSEN